MKPTEMYRQKPFEVFQNGQVPKFTRHTSWKVTLVKYAKERHWYGNDMDKILENIVFLVQFVF